MAKTVTLSDTAVLNLARNPNARRRVPALNAVYNTITRQNGGKRGCSSCARKAKLSQSVAAVRRTLANQPASLLAIKQLLGADKLIIYFKGQKGITVRKEV